MIINHKNTNRWMKRHIDELKTHNIIIRQSIYLHIISVCNIINIWSWWKLLFTVRNYCKCLNMSFWTLANIYVHFSICKVGGVICDISMSCFLNIFYMTVHNICDTFFLYNLSTFVEIWSEFQVFWVIHQPNIFVHFYNSIILDVAMSLQMYFAWI